MKHEADKEAERATTVRVVRLRRGLARIGYGLRRSERGKDLFLVYSDTELFRASLRPVPSRDDLGDPHTPFSRRFTLGEAEKFLDQQHHCRKPSDAFYDMTPHGNVCADAFRLYTPAQSDAIQANQSVLHRLLDADAIAASGVNYSDGTPLIATWCDLAMRAHPSIMGVGVNGAMAGPADTSADLCVDYACDFDPCLPSSASTSGLFTVVSGIQQALGASLTSTRGTLDYAIWNVQCMDANGNAHVLDECPKGVDCSCAPQTLGQYLTSKGYGPKHLNLYLYPQSRTFGGHTLLRHAG